MTTLTISDVRQGDVLPGGALPLSSEGSVEEWVVISQSCDLVGSSESEPLIQFCPVVQLDADRQRLAQKRWLPRFVAIPGTEDAFADLSDIRSIAKEAVDWTRSKSAAATDAERRDFAVLVGRRFGRFAFPDDFSAMFNGLRLRLREKVGKQSTEGALIEEVIEVRAYVHPDWAAPEAETTLVMLFPSDFVSRRKLKAEDVEAVRKQWRALCAPTGTIASVELSFMTADMLSAEDYMNGFQVDLAAVS